MGFMSAPIDTSLAFTNDFVQAIGE